jgi:alpha-galactosidase
MFVSQDGSQAVLFYFQIRSLVNHAFPRLKLQGLHAHSTYFVNGEGPFSGQTLMNLGLQYSFESDYGSRVILLEKQHTS